MYKLIYLQEKFCDRRNTSMGTSGYSAMPYEVDDCCVVLNRAECPRALTVATEPVALYGKNPRWSLSSPCWQYVIITPGEPEGNEWAFWMKFQMEYENLVIESVCTVLPLGLW